MAKLAIKKATTSVTLYLFIQNSSVSTGAGLTGLVFNSAGLVAYQVRPLAAAVAITLATQTVTGAFSSGGFVEVDATNMPGVYRFDVPNAVIDTGVNSVVVMLKGATNMAPVVIEIDLVAYDPQSATNLGLSQVDAATSSRMATYTQPTGFLAATFPAGTVANTINITAGTITTATNLTTNNDKTGYTLSSAGVQAVWDALTTALTTAGSIGKKLADWVIGTAQTGDSFARLGAPAGANVSADVAAVKAETASIQADTNDLQTRVPAALVGGRMDSNASAINGIATAAARLARSTQGIVLGTVGAASTTTSIVTSSLDPAAAVIDQYKGRIVTFDQGTTTANLRGQSTDITANTAAGVLTTTALTTAPVSGDTFTIT